jgi:hypothetical protein
MNNKKIKIKKNQLNRRKAKNRRKDKKNSKTYRKGLAKS